MSRRPLPVHPPRSLIQAQQPSPFSSYLLNSSNSPNQTRTLQQVKDCLLQYGANYIHDTSFMRMHGQELTKVLHATMEYYQQTSTHVPSELKTLEKTTSRAARFAERYNALNLSDAGNDYRMCQQLPVNSCFGSVFLAQDINAPEKGTLVIKRSSKKRMYEVCYKSVKYEDPLREVWINQQLLAHIRENGGMERVVGAKYLCLVQDSRDDSKNQELWNVSKFMAGGDLFQYLMSIPDGQCMEEWRVRKLFFQILCGVYFFHRVLPSPHALNDISLENILLNERADEAFICDFATVFEAPAGNTLQFADGKAPGKSNYHSYELLSGVAFNPLANDMFALGVCLWMMLSRVPAFDRAMSADERYKMIQQGKLNELIHSWQLTMSEEAVDLVNKLMKKESERCTIEEALLHPFVAEQMYDACKNDPVSVYAHMAAIGTEHQAAIVNACQQYEKTRASSLVNAGQLQQMVNVYDNVMEFDEKLCEPTQHTNVLSSSHSPSHSPSYSLSSSTQPHFYSEFESMVADSSSDERLLCFTSCSSSSSSSPALFGTPKSQALPLPSSTFNMAAIQAKWEVEWNSSTMDSSAYCT